jgi:hypothetical protein
MKHKKLIMCVDYYKKYHSKTARRWDYCIKGNGFEVYV